MTTEQRQRLTDVIAHCLLMGQGVFASPEEFALAIQMRLLREGYRIICDDTAT